MSVKIKDKQEHGYDFATLDQVSLCLDAGEDRIQSAGAFHVEVCGEGFDVARGLDTCFGFAAAIVTALADDDVGKLIVQHVKSGGVDASQTKWMSSAGKVPSRNSIVFAERGRGIRQGRSLVDGLSSSAARLQPFDIDWTRLFSHQGVRWFHVDSRFASLSDSAAQSALAAVRAAKRSGSMVSYTIANGAPGQQVVNTFSIHNEIAQQADVLVGSSAAISGHLGIENVEMVKPDNYQQFCAAIKRSYPQLRIIFTPLCHKCSATVCDWAALAWDGSQSWQSVEYRQIDVCDYAGVTSAFIAGAISGLLQGGDIQMSLDYGVAHGALVMSTPYSASRVTLNDVKALMQIKGSVVRDPSPQWSLVGWSSGEW
jgi:2-dehydro-3-deoxygluconokinase